MTAAEKITKARAGLVLDLPFFGSLALRLKCKPDETCQTAWTDGQSIGYNPEFIDPLPLDQVKGLLAHEVMHLACSHHTRRGNRDPKKWNIAGDFAINQILEDSKIALPSGRLLDPAYRGMSTDEIYSKLPIPQEQDGNDGKQGNDPGKCGEIRDAQGKNGQKPSEADLSQSEQDWKIAVTQAAQQAKAMGKLPDSLKRLVGEILKPAVDWKDVLRRFVDQSAKNDYSWSRPNRRFIGQGLYLPSLHSEELPPIVIAVDTSGSIDSDIINQFSAEITAILEDYKTSCTVIYCDSKIGHIETFASDDLPLKLNPVGGGGTDFRNVFTFLELHDKLPSCLVYLTDLAGTFPNQEPAYPVLWAKIGDYNIKAPFGEEVKINGR